MPQHPGPGPGRSFCYWSRFCRDGRGSARFGLMMRMSAAAARTTAAARLVGAAFVAFPGGAVARGHAGETGCGNHPRRRCAATRAGHRFAVFGKRPQRAEAAAVAAVVVVHRHGGTPKPVHKTILTHRSPQSPRRNANDNFALFAAFGVRNVVPCTQRDARKSVHFRTATSPPPAPYRPAQTPPARPHSGGCRSRRCRSAAIAWRRRSGYRRCR